MKFFVHFFLGFFFVSISTLSAWSAPLVDRLEASVNGATVLNSDISRFRNTIGLREQLDPLFARSPLAQKKGAATNQEILNFLVEERLVLSAFPVTDAEVETEISGIQTNNRITRDALVSLLRQQGFSFEQYFSLIRVGSAKRMLIDREIRSKVVITDDDIRNHYYNTISKNSSLPRAYHVFLLATSPSSSDGGSEARNKIQAAKSLLSKGTSFEEVAKKYSDDPSAEQGGDLGYLSEDQMASFIRNELKRLRVGETSDILGSRETRFFIVRLAGVRSQEDEFIKKQSEEIRTQLASVEYAKQISLWLDRQKNSAQLHFHGINPFEKK